VKVLRERDDVSGARFFLEARVLAELRHPGIVRYISHGTTLAGEHYLAMEWLTGESLADRLKQGPIALRDVVTLAARAADALGAAHAAGVVHRDVKPSNLYLVGGSIERLKVLDFGVARRGPHASEHTPHGGRVGTPRYMSPEQVRGDKIDARADVFALGSLLYLCLTGRQAFVGHDEMAVLAKILLEEPPLVNRLRREVPAPLAELVARMMAKDVAARPADGRAVAAELAAVADATRTAGSELVGPAPERRLLTVVMVSRPPTPPGPIAEDLARARAAARRHGADLTPLDGGFVAVVPAQRSATDQAAHAARLALALRPLLPDRPIAVGTGMGATGTVPAGQAIDRAARLLLATAPGLFVDEVTAGLLDQRFDIRAGTLIGEREDPSELRTVLGKTTPHVGRERELGMLETVFAESATDAVAHAVLVTGLPGAGKSRLAQELIRRRGDATVLLARGDPMRAGSPFSLVAPAIRRAAGLDPADPAERQRAALAARVAERVPAGDAPRVARFLGELIGLPFPDDDDVQLQAARQDAVLMGDQMRRAWEDFLAAETAARPVLLVLEDLQWGDLPSVHLVDAALRNLPHRPIMVLALARPEVRLLFPGLWSERGMTELRLGALSRKASERLVRAILPDLDAATVDRLIERAQGNAFYLEELIRAVAAGAPAFPDTVLAMVQARLAGESAEARRILRAASIFGCSFWAGGVTAVLGDARDLAEWLPILCDREMIVPVRDSRFPGEVEYVFRHELSREAAYATFDDGERERAHRAAGDWLERAGEADAFLLAEQLRRGGEPLRAAAWYRRAAEQALEGNDFLAAVERADRGIACGADEPTRVELLLLAIEAHRWRGENELRERRCREVMALSGPGDRAWCAAAAELAASSVKLGTRETAVALARDLAALPPQPSAPLWSAIARTATVLLLLGLIDEADRLLDRLQLSPVTRALLGPTTAAAIDSARGVRALMSGDLASFLRLYQASVDALELAGNQRRAIEARSNLAFGLIEIGAYSEAERILRANVIDSERLGQDSSKGHALQNLGWALARQGKLAEARRVEDRAVGLFERQRARYHEGGSRLYLARILAEAGQPELAEAEARRALDLLVAAPPLRCFGMAVLADALGRRGLVAEAAAAAGEAMTILGTSGEISEGESFVRLIFAEALHAAGRVEEGAAARAAARARLVERAARISDVSLRERFLTEVPENARTLRTPDR